MSTGLDPATRARCRERRPERHARGLSRPAPRVRRPAGRLPGLVGDLAHPRAGRRRDGRLLPLLSLLGPPRRLPARGRGDRRVRGGARADRPLAGIERRGDDLHRQRHRVDQPGRLHVGAPERLTRRPDRAHRGRAPLQRRPLAAAGGRRRRRARLRADRRRRAPRRAVADRAARARTQAARARPHLQCARHDQPGRRDHRARPRGRCGRRSSTAPRRSPRSRSTCTRSTPTSTPGPATSSTARPASACCTAAASCWRRCRRSWAAGT